MDFTNFDWAAYDAMPSRDEILGTHLEKWFKHQYVTEVKTILSYQQNRRNRLGMVYGWRLQRSISLWNALPGETRPEELARKPTDASLNKQAREAWERCDKKKAQELYDMWNHKCKDPYYCPMHGFGSD